jgi:prefoldin subunit 5
MGIAQKIQEINAASAEMANEAKALQANINALKVAVDEKNKKAEQLAELKKQEAELLKQLGL